MKQSYRETISYSNTYLEQLFAGWFEREDEAKGAELFQQAEIELRLEIDNQMPYIRYICRNHPAVGAEALRVDVEGYALEIACNRKHRDSNELLGDFDKR